MPELIAEIEYPKQCKYYSISRLKTYSQCSEMFRLKYVEKIPVPSLSQATLIGSLCHDALEILHSDFNPGLQLLDILKISGRKTLKERRIFKKETDPEVFTSIYNQLLDFAQDSLSLYERASDRYTGNLAIRKKDNGIALVPSSTAGWKRSEEALKLTDRREKIDTLAGELNPELKEFSLSGTFAEAWSICFKYSVPKEVKRTISVEFPISEYSDSAGVIKNPVLMPEEFGGSEEIFLTGFVDWIGMIEHEGREKLTILDYKSSKEDLKPQQVQYNVQLYSYVYSYEILTGETVELIGIHNLRTGNLVVVPVDRAKMKDVLASMFFKHKMIGANMFYKQIPDSQYSTCLNSFGKRCSYLQFCYPELHEELNPQEQEEQLEEKFKQLAEKFNLVN